MKYWHNAVGALGAALFVGGSATGLVLHGDPMNQLGSWTRLLVAFDVVYGALCGLLFARVVED